jgi:phage-related protein
MSLTVGKLLALLDADPSGFDRGLDAAELRMLGFQRSVDGKLRDLKGRFASEGALAGRGFGAGVEEGGRRGLPGMRGVGGAMALALRTGLIGGLGGGAAQLVTALAPAIGAIGLIPAAALAGATALATLKIGLSGIGDALKAGMAGDTEKYNEALKGLAPAARDAVKALVGLKPQLDAVKQTVQQNLFAGLAGDIKALGGAYLPILRTELGNTATGFNEVIGSITNMARAPGFVESISLALHNVMLAITNVIGIFPGLVSGFTDIATVGSTFLPQLTAGFGDLGDKFANFIANATGSGQLASFIQGGIDALKLLGGLLMDVGRILDAVFAAMGSAGGDALGVFGTLIGVVADFLQSAQGMNALSALFGILGTVAGAMGSILAAILPMVGDLLAALLPAVAPLVDMLTGDLVPIIVQLAGTLAKALLPILSAFATALANVIPALMPIIALLGGALGAVITALAPVITVLAQVIAQILVQALQALMPVFAVLLPVIVQLVQAVLPALIPLIQLVGKLFAALMPAIAPLINLLVVLLVPILKLLTPIIQLLAIILGAVGQVLIWIITPIADFIGWLAKGLASAGMWKAIGHWFADLWHMITDAFNRGVQWVKQKWDDFVANVKAIPRKVTDALGDFGSLLLDKGKDLVRGLWNGIQSMGKWLADKIGGWVKDAVPGPIAHFLGISSPSKVAAALGRWVPIGLAQGIDSGAGQVMAAAARMAAAALPTLGVPGAGGLALPGGRSTAGQLGPITVQAFIGNEQLEPHMTRVIEGNPETVALANRAGTKRLAYT